MKSTALNRYRDEIDAIGRPFRMRRDPNRPEFGFIDRVRVTFKDGGAAVITVAELNRIKKRTRPEVDR